MQIGPPHGVLPAVVPAEALIARTDEVAISLGSIWVYPTGLEFEVFADMKDEWSDLDPFGVDRTRRRDEAGGGDLLRLGFRFGDASEVTCAGGEWAPPVPGSTSPTLTGMGGGRRGGHCNFRYWLWPLPPADALRFICEWPAAGVPMTETELDCAAIQEAAPRARTIFATDGESLDG